VRLVSNDSDDLGGVVLRQPVDKSRRLAPRRECLHGENGQIVVSLGNDFCRLLRSQEWTRANYVQGFNDRPESGGDFLHLSLARLRERSLRVAQAGCGERFGFLGDSVSDDQ
jgi:hypothetical protein